MGGVRGPNPGGDGKCELLVIGHQSRARPAYTCCTASNAEEQILAMGVRAQGPVTKLCHVSIRGMDQVDRLAHIRAKIAMSSRRIGD